MDLPKFFGIDIGKNTVKVAYTENNVSPLRLKKAFSFQTGPGGLGVEDPNQRTDLAVRIRDAIAGAKLDTNKCIVALPEPAVFNRLLTFPALEEDKLNEAIHWNAKQFIPIPLEDVQMDWIKTAELTAEGKKMIQLLLVAAPKKLINNTLAVFKEAELEVIAIETEAVATARIIANAYPNAGSMLVLDIGSSGTDLSVVDNNNLIFSQSFGTGSEAMTKAIASNFNLDPVQAEQYKIKFGMMPNQAEGKIVRVLEPVLQLIISEVSRTITFFQNKYSQVTPKRVILLGEGAKTPGLAEYFQLALNMPTEIANLTNNLQIDPSLAAELQSQNSLVGYGVALGLALKTK